MGLFDQFPYTNFHELNLMWILEALKEIKTTTEQFVAINSLKYADPIQWNITSQYEKNTIVIDPQTGTAYISVQPVPTGVIITNTDYWSVVFDLGSFITKAAQNFTDRWEEATTLTATFASGVNDWLVWGDRLYRVLSPITAGDQYVIGSNIEHFTLESIIGHLEDLNTTDKSNLVAAINEVLQTLFNTTGDLDDLNTIDKSNLVAAINEVLQTLFNTTGDLDDLNTIDKSNLVAATNEILDKYNSYKIVNVKDYGVVGDGSTDDTAAINACILQFANIGYVPDTTRKRGVIIYFPSGSYCISDSIILYPFIHILGAGVHATDIRFKDDAPINSIMFKTWNYDNFINSTGGYYYPDGVPMDFSVCDMTLYGSATTVTNGSAFAIFGYSYRLENIEIYYFGADGIYSDYTNDPNQYYYMSDDKFYESVLRNVSIRQCGVRGIDWHGPTDAYFDNVNVSECNAPVAVEIYAPIYINAMHIYGNGTTDNVSSGIAFHSNSFCNLLISENNTGVGVSISNNIWNVTFNTLEVYDNAVCDFSVEPNCKYITVGQLLGSRHAAGDLASIEGEVSIAAGVLRGHNTAGAVGLRVAASATVNIDNLRVIDFASVGLKVGQGGTNSHCHIRASIENCATAVETGAGLGGDCDIILDIIRSASQTSLSWAFSYTSTDVIFIREFDGTNWSILNDIRPARASQMRLGSNYQLQNYDGTNWNDLPYVRLASNNFEVYDSNTDAWRAAVPNGYVVWDDNAQHLSYYMNGTWTFVPNL